MRRRPLSLVAAALAAVALSGCNAGSDGARVARSVPLAAASPSASASTSSPAAAAPSATGSPSATATPSATASPSPTPPRAPAYDVAAVQRRLAELRYYGGPVDGRPGAVLAAAVMAFEKVQGLPLDGAVGPRVLGALAAPKPPVLKATAPADRVEVDLTKQVLYVVKGGAVTRIMAVSSGSGVTYQEKDGSTARALTPVGWFTIGRRVVGAEKAPLGVLYDPQYFYQGWAIHGSNSVPAYPASHGCVRVNRWDGTWLFGQLRAGTPVYLYGGAYTFTAGSNAAGTSTPGGDAPDRAPSSAPPATTPAPSASAAPTTPAPTASGTA